MAKVPTLLTVNNDSAECLVDAYLHTLPKEMRGDVARAALVLYTERVISSVALSFEKASANAIRYAAELLCDPDFYEKHRQRRSRRNREFQESMERQKQERLMRRLEKPVGGVQ